MNERNICHTLAFIIAAVFSLSCLANTLHAQTVTLTFTGQDAANQNVQLDMVIVTNVTRGWQELLFWDDTVLVMEHEIGIPEMEANEYLSLRLEQNTPNPFAGTTDAHLTVADAGEVILEIADANGRIVGTHRMRPQSGTHKFHITLATAGTYMLTARQNGQSSSIKMVCNGGGNGNRIEYLGSVETCHGASLRQMKSTTNRPFQIGDQMEYVGNALINGEDCESQPLTQTLEGSQTIALQFNETQLHFNLPTVITDSVSNIADFTATCGGTVTDDGGDDPATNNATGFGALPAGCYYDNVIDGYIFLGRGFNTFYWTATANEDIDDFAYYRGFHTNYDSFFDVDLGDIPEGYSVRCVHN